MPAVIKVVDGRTVIRAGENTAEAARQARLAATDRAIAETSAAFAEEFSGPAYTTRSVGEAATSEGQFFRVPLGTTPETYTRYQRTAGGSIEAAALATTADLASPDPTKGASLVVKTDGQTLQGFADETKTKLDRTVYPEDFPGANDDERIAAALTYLQSGSAESRGTLRLLGNTYTTTLPIMIPSNITVEGSGNETLIDFYPPDPTAYSGPGARLGHIRGTALVMVGASSDVGTNNNTTGDYYETSPRAFATNTVLAEGATSFPVANSSDLAGLGPGDWLWLQRGWIGWHTCVHEAVQIKSISGTTVNLVRPIENKYSNRSDDAFNAFIDAFAYPANTPPPGVTQAAFDGFLQCGWRPFTPCYRAAAKNLRIRNNNVYSGYANLAVGIFRAVDCQFENLTIEAGGLWNIDSQGTIGRGLFADPAPF